MRTQREQAGDDSLKNLLTGDWTGVIAALPAEAASLQSPPPAPQELVALDAYRRLVVSGMGAQRAEQAARNLVTLGARALISWGTAGGLNPALKPGTLLLCSQVLTLEGPHYRTDAAWLERLRLALGGQVPSAPGNLLSSAEVLNTVAEKARAHARTGAQAVDMETAAIARVAEQNHLPLLVVRVIVDTASDALPPSALAAVDLDGRSRPLALLGSLARRPGDIGGLIQLGSRFARAKHSLSTIAQQAPGVLVYR